MQGTTQRRKQLLLGLSAAGSLVQQMLVPDVTLSANKTRLIARLEQRQEGKICWPIFQLAELVFFRASTITYLNILEVVAGRNTPSTTNPLRRVWKDRKKLVLHCTFQG